MNIPGVFTNNPFPERTQIQKSYVDGIVEQAKSIDLDKVDYANVDFKPRAEITEKQKVYFWIRVYLHNEIDIKPDTDVSIQYVSSGEKLITKFICFAKQGINKDMEENVINYNPEEDKKVLCLMIDSERIDNNSDDIPFIRTLFRIGKYYTPQILRNSDMLISDSSGNKLDFYDIDF
jgi:hypothetical protein